MNMEKAHVKNIFPFNTMQRELKATNTSQNENNLIVKMAPHKGELNSELGSAKKELGFSEERTSKILKDIKVCRNSGGSSMV